MADITDEIRNVLIGRVATAKVLKFTDCPVCFGFSEKKCWYCDKKRRPRKDMTKTELITMDCIKELEKWLSDTKNRARKYDMPSTGSITLDDMVKKKYGISALNE